LCISKATKNPDLAWAFIKMVTSNPWATRFSQSRKLLTGNVAADRAGLDALKKDDPLGAQVLQTQLEHTDKFTGNWPLPFDAQLKDAFYPEIQNAVLGRKTPKAALTDAERAVNRVLSRNI
jgi:ABC-type glycerol-3-phosphate transport system substrate-binding protein